ncbi:MAG TPA: hypothetical protein VMW20_10405 [Candidatus Nanoarchaeia archaeon]|nr:hypothetical protein [Candidatus Nanoarchaeia archaeon]
MAIFLLGICQRWVYIDILKDETTWIKRFSDMKSEFKNRPAFLDEVRHLDHK